MNLIKCFIILLFSQLAFAQENDESCILVSADYATDFYYEEKNQCTYLTCSTKGYSVLSEALDDCRKSASSMNACGQELISNKSTFMLLNKFGGLTVGDPKVHSITFSNCKI